MSSAQVRRRDSYYAPGRRRVPVDADTLGLLRKLQAEAAPGNPYLFVSARRWKQATARQAAGKWRRDIELVCAKQKKWQEIVAAAKLKTDDAPPVFYSLRKTCCCDMLTRGPPGHEVRQLMGHADLETTLRWYSKVNREDAEWRATAAGHNLRREGTDGCELKADSRQLHRRGFEPLTFGSVDRCSIQLS